jgi:hypothetical protein
VVVRSRLNKTALLCITVISQSGLLKFRALAWLRVLLSRLSFGAFWHSKRHSSSRCLL